jgi:hypothetical protein
LKSLPGSVLGANNHFSHFAQAGQAKQSSEAPANLKPEEVTTEWGVARKEGAHRVARKKDAPFASPG